MPSLLREHRGRHYDESIVYTVGIQTSKGGGKGWEKLTLEKGNCSSMQSSYT